MISKNFTLFNFLDITNWHEIYDFKIMVDFSLFEFFINGYETYFEQIDLNTMYNTYFGKKIYLKIGIDLTSFETDCCCMIHFWINNYHFTTENRIPYNIFNYDNKILFNGSIPIRIRSYFYRNVEKIIIYKKM